MTITSQPSQPADSWTTAELAITVQSAVPLTPQVQPVAPTAISGRREALARIEVTQTDFFELYADAWFKSASTELELDSAVGQRLHKRLGTSFSERLKAQAPVNLGEAVIVELAEGFPARYLVLAPTVDLAGKQADPYPTDESVSQALLAGLREVEKRADIRTLVILSTGTAWGRQFPVEIAPRMLQTAAEYLEQGSRLERIIFSNPDAQLHRAYQAAHQALYSAAVSPTADSTDSVDWYAQVIDVPTKELVIGESYTITVRFTRTTGDKVRVPKTTQALMVYIEASPGLQLESAPQLPVKASSGVLLEEQVEVRFRPVISTTVELTVAIYVGREVEDVAPVLLPPISLHIAPAKPLDNIPEILDRRLIPAPQPDVQLYVALEAIPATTETPDGMQMRMYLACPALALDLSFDPLPLTAQDVEAIGAAAAATALEANRSKIGSDNVSLRRFGMALYDLLMPPTDDQRPSLRAVYWKLLWLARRMGRTLSWLIISDSQAVIPWEMVRPYAETGREEEFLGVQFLMSHWIGRSHLRMEKEVPVRKLELVHYAQHVEELPRWQRTFGGTKWVEAPKASTSLLLTQLASDVAGLHLLRYREDGMAGPVVSAGNISIDDPVAVAASQHRLDFAARRPIIGISYVDSTASQRRPDNGAIPSSLVDDWALRLLRAGTSAIVGPRWPTAAESDRRFYRIFYAAIRAGKPLGEAVLSARQAVRTAFPQRGDWLAYTHFGHPLGQPYLVVSAEAYAVFEIINYPDGAALEHGKEYTFRATYRALAPEQYHGRVYLEHALPELAEPNVIVDANFLDEPLHKPLRRIGDLGYEEMVTLCMPDKGDVARLAVFFQDGDNRLQTLDLYLHLVRESAS